MRARKLSVAWMLFIAGCSMGCVEATDEYRSSSSPVDPSSVGSSVDASATTPSADSGTTSGSSTDDTGTVDASQYSDKLEIKFVKWYVVGDYIECKGTIENKTDEKFWVVFIELEFTDDSGKVVDVDSYPVTDLFPNSKQSWESTTRIAGRVPTSARAYLGKVTK